jgi:DNA-directed RNA polymerase subunit RPC12/RpoP
VAVKLLKTKCPHCSAPIRIDTTADHITCEFCRQSSLLERPGRKVERNAQTMHFATIDVAAAQQARRKVIVILVRIREIRPIWKQISQ